MDYISGNNIINNEQKKFTFVNFLVKNAIAANEKQAKTILVISSVIFLAISAMLFLSTVQEEKVAVKYQLSEDVIKTLPPDVQEKVRSQNNK